MIFATGRLKELPIAAPVLEEMATPVLGLRMPLKVEDRSPAPSFDEEAEPQPVGTHSNSVHAH